ncbi:unnamed protein product [Amoebophrya sp. A25]|nr:unnamed protein product [Amoebophrya sp. A25]|eukprot:GSA25T00024224001.1
MDSLEQTTSGRAGGGASSSPSLMFQTGGGFDPLPIATAPSFLGSNASTSSPSRTATLGNTFNTAYNNTSVQQLQQERWESGESRLKEYESQQLLKLHEQNMAELDHLRKKMLGQARSRSVSPERENRSPETRTTRSLFTPLENSTMPAALAAGGPTSSFSTAPTTTATAPIAPPALSSNIKSATFLQEQEQYYAAALHSLLTDSVSSSNAADPKAELSFQNDNMFLPLPSSSSSMINRSAVGSSGPAQGSSSSSSNKKPGHELRLSEDERILTHQVNRIQEELNQRRSRKNSDTSSAPTPAGPSKDEAQRIFSILTGKSKEDEDFS